MANGTTIQGANTAVLNDAVNNTNCNHSTAQTVSQITRAPPQIGTFICTLSIIRRTLNSFPVNSKWRPPPAIPTLASSPSSSWRPPSYCSAWVQWCPWRRPVHWTTTWWTASTLPVTWAALCPVALASLALMQPRAQEPPEPPELPPLPPPLERPAPWWPSASCPPCCPPPWPMSSRRCRT